MKRREFILGSMAAAWPVVAPAQQGERVRKIGVLSPSADSDSDSLARDKAFRDSLQALGWSVGRNIQFNHRWAAGDSARLQAYAKELVAQAPDVIFAANSVQTVNALRKETSTIPIVFGSASDPVDAGLVASLARPGGNITGFTSIQAATNIKYLELIKDLAPGVARVMVLMSTDDPSNLGRFRAIQTGGPALKVDVIQADVRTQAEIEHAIGSFASDSNRALIVLPNAVATAQRETIIAMAARYRVPAVYPFRYYATSGGLLSYGLDLIDQFRRAASYVDRILKGEKPGDLPVQTPTKFELVINLKTAKTLGLEVPPTLIARADEVIE